MILSSSGELQSIDHAATAKAGIRARMIRKIDLSRKFIMITSLF